MWLAFEPGSDGELLLRTNTLRDAKEWLSKIYDSEVVSRRRKSGEHYTTVLVDGDVVAHVMTPADLLNILGPGVNWSNVVPRHPHLKIPRFKLLDIDIASINKIVREGREDTHLYGLPHVAIILGLLAIGWQVPQVARALGTSVGFVKSVSATPSAFFYAIEVQ